MVLCMIFNILAGADTLSNIGGQAYCFNKMTSNFPIVWEQKSIVFPSIWGGGGRRPPLYFGLFYEFLRVV